MKAKKSSEVKRFTDIPNIGPRMAHDFKMLGIKGPKDLQKQDAFKLYKKMCAITHSRQDPCVLDTYMAAIDFMNGAPATPWWKYTHIRKKQYPDI